MKMVTAKTKATTIFHKFLLAHNSHNPSFGHTKSLFIQKKQTNCYPIAVTLRLGLSSQVTRAHFISTRVIFPLLFSITSKYLQYWIMFKTLDWLSSTELSYHTYLLTILLHHVSLKNWKFLNGLLWNIMGITLNDGKIEMPIHIIKQITHDYFKGLNTRTLKKVLDILNNGRV
jgi:hypothetical protein